MAAGVAKGRAQGGSCHPAGAAHGYMLGLLYVNHLLLLQVRFIGGFARESGFAGSSVFFFGDMWHRFLQAGCQGPQGNI